MRKNSIKNIRINQEVQRELSVLIAMELKDPRIHPMTSVVSVNVTPDLKTAKVYVSVLGDDRDRQGTLIGLNSAAPFLRGQLAKTLNLRNTPELIFLDDQSIEYGVKMSKRIDDVAKIDRQAAIDRGDAEPGYSDEGMDALDEELEDLDEELDSLDEE
ncbi:MAG: 30S ribosome-binding factor RbfA [Lachnospiraceae bacterium]|nr:30S ribosome-binding factor RbfA [Lachnospiraceae bacterium]